MRDYAPEFEEEVLRLRTVWATSRPANRRVMEDFPTMRCHIAAAIMRNGLASFGRHLRGSSFSQQQRWQSQQNLQISARTQFLGARCIGATVFSSPPAVALCSVAISIAVTPAVSEKSVELFFAVTTTLLGTQDTAWFKLQNLPYRRTPETAQLVVLGARPHCSIEPPVAVFAFARCPVACCRANVKSMQSCEVAAGDTHAISSVASAE